MKYKSNKINFAISAEEIINPECTVTLGKYKRYMYSTCCQTLNLQTFYNIHIFA